MNSCSGFSDLCTCTDLCFSYMASVFLCLQLSSLKVGSCLVIIWGHDGSRESAWDLLQ